MLSQLGTVPGSSARGLLPRSIPSRAEFGDRTVSEDELHGIIIPLPSSAPGKMQKVIFPPLAA